MDMKFSYRLPLNFELEYYSVVYIICLNISFRFIFCPFIIGSFSFLST